MANLRSSVDDFVFCGGELQGAWQVGHAGRAAAQAGRQAPACLGGAERCTPTRTPRAAAGTLIHPLVVMTAGHVSAAARLGSTVLLNGRLHGMMAAPATLTSIPHAAPAPAVPEGPHHRQELHRAWAQPARGARGGLPAQ